MTEDLTWLASATRKLRFSTSGEIRPALEAACSAHPDVARFEQIGTSEEGRPIDGVLLGTGSMRVSLVAGAHADEPVGPETLRLLILGILHHRDRFRSLLRRFRFAVVPHINPDGEARNAVWTAGWPDAAAYLRHAVREKPGRDLEYGFPDMRKENRAVAAFLTANAPFRLHMSLHGMGFAEGGMLLVDPAWIDRTETLRARYAGALSEHGVGLHDHDRKGEKGFAYLGPGFWTTPSGTAMRDHFLAIGDEETARKFHLSSMEFVRNLGGQPLCLVTEIPLFVLSHEEIRSSPGIPAVYLAWKERQPAMSLGLPSGESLDALAGGFRIEPVAIGTAIRLQLTALEMGVVSV